MSSATYHIADEPRPGGLAHLAVNPIWPLLALMLTGSWLAFPWFVLNSFALGSPTRAKELGAAVFALLGLCVLVAGILGADTAGLFQSALHVKLALLVATAWKLGAGYVLFGMQGRTQQLYEYYGGKVSNGLPVLLVAYLLRGSLFAQLPLFLQLVFR